MCLKWTTKAIHQLVGAFDGAVNDMDLGDLALAQCLEDCTARSTGTKNDGAFDPVPTGLCASRLATKPRPSVLVACSLPSSRQSVFAAPSSSARESTRSASRQAASLGDRDVSTAEGRSLLFQACDEIRKIGRRDSDLLVGSLQTKDGQPMSVDQWRTGMLDRVAGDKARAGIVSRESRMVNSKLPQFFEEGKQRQAQDGEVIASDRIEQLNALPFQLIAATLERTADPFRAR